MAKELNLNLPSADDLFTTQDERDNAKLEKIMIVPASEVYPYVRQPYQTNRLTSDLVKLMDSIGRHGIESPLIVRPRAEGGYEIISGHRRDYCGQVHNIPDRPIIIRDYTDDQADILVADLNIAREKPLFSELAKSYKLRYDAMKRQGKRTDLTFGQSDQKLPKQNSRQELAVIVGKTEDDVRRILDLNNLIPELLALVDNSVDREKGKLFIAMRPGSELSRLPKEQQQMLFAAIESECCTPSHDQTLRMRDKSKEGELDEDTILSIMQEEKPNQVEQFKLPKEKINRFFAPGTPADKIENDIIKGLELLQRKRERDNAR